MRNLAFVFLILLSLSGCSEDDTVGVSYAAYNHTDEHIVSIVINGRGGILDASAHGAGGGVCCVVLPKKWRPGLMAKIEWQMDGHWLRDDKGSYVLRGQDKVFVEGIWKEKTVEVPRYDSNKGMGRFFIHFFPDDEVKVLVNLYDAGHPNHPYPSPSGRKFKEY